MRANEGNARNCKEVRESVRKYKGNTRKYGECEEMKENARKRDKTREIRENTRRGEK